MLKIKSGSLGALIAGARPEIVVGIIAANDVFREFGLDCVITEVTGGRHSAHSRHKVGLATDLRKRNIPKDQVKKLVRTLARNLGDNFDIVDEGDHIHIEFDPER